MSLTAWKVYLSHVESVLYQHPNVQQALVFGVSGSGNDERVGVAVAPRVGVKLTEAVVRQ